MQYILTYLDPYLALDGGTPAHREALSSRKAACHILLVSQIALSPMRGAPYCLLTGAHTEGVGDKGRSDVSRGVTRRGDKRRGTCD